MSLNATVAERPVAATAAAPAELHRQVAQVVRPTPALVLCEGLNSLAVIRGLAQVGIPSIALAMDPKDDALWSRYPASKLRVPQARGQTRDDALLEALLSLPDEQLVVIPTSDWHVAFLARHRQRLAGRFRFSIPSDELVHSILDKSREILVMQRLGIPVPESLVALPETPREMREALGLPVVIKPRSFAHRTLVNSKVVVLRNPSELEAFYASHRHALPGLVAQEVIPGGDDALWKCDCTFNRSSELVQAFTFHKLRMTPAHFGVASLAVSQFNSHVVRLAERLGRTLRYVGPANLEFKYDQRDGQYKYIEMNPRLGLCNYFDTRCGINNAWHTYRLALGQDLPPQATAQQDGVIYCAFFEDLYARVNDGERLGSVLRQYLTYWNRRRVGAYFAWHDPLPGVINASRWLGRLGRGLARKLFASHL